MARSRTTGKTRTLGRVLVVEDDAVLALATEDALRDAGAEEVMICSTTAEALKVLRESSLDGLVLDVHLADRDDGWALVELVEMLGTKRPRIVFSTGAPQDIPPEIAETGAVFEKPYNPADLAGALAGEEKRGLFSRLRDVMG